MRSKFDTIPFLRFTISFSAGIIAGTLFRSPNMICVALFIILWILLVWFQRRYSYKHSVSFGIAANLILFVSGMLVHAGFNYRPVFYTNGTFTGVICETIEEKKNSYHTAVQVKAFMSNDSLISLNEKVLVYFEKDSISAGLQPGQFIVFRNSPEIIRDNGHPFEFNYKRYMERRRVFRRVYLDADSWCSADVPTPFNLSLLAEKARFRLLNVYTNQKWDQQQKDVISALTLGYKRSLDPEIKRTFASAGAMHILAVSGLHTGIIFLILTYSLGFLRKHSRGKIIFLFVTIACLWAFALLTGLSPSVKRAATMFTFLTIGQSLRRQVNTYNTLAASAFFLLLFNPNNLLDAGFQLSYSAVFGIVYFHPKIKKILPVKKNFPGYFWNLLSVSIAAQIATFPLSVYYFNQFPVYFWLSNLLIIPVVAALVPLGIVLLAFSWVSIISIPVSWITGVLLRGMIEYLKLVEQLPHSVFRINFSEMALFAFIFMLFSVIFFMERRNKTSFRFIMVSLALMLGTGFYRQLIAVNRKEIIIYTQGKHLVAHFIKGKQNYVISEEVISTQEAEYHPVQTTVTQLDLNEPVYLTFNQQYLDSFLYFKNGFILFEGLVVHFDTEGGRQPGPFVPDVIIGENKDYSSVNPENAPSVILPGPGQNRLKVTDIKLPGVKSKVVKMM